MRYSPFRYATNILWKKRPIQLTFFVTRKCNARCPFCFYLQANRSHEPSSSELSLQEISRISRSLGNLLWLAFSGGEIYLRNDLPEISSLFYSNNRPAIMLYPTNGLLPQLIHDTTREILERCPRSTVVVKLSIDGLNNQHDSLRGTPGGFEKILQTYRLLAALLDRYPNFELGVNTVFCSENQHNMDEIIDFSGELKHCKTHTISLVRGDLNDRSFTKIDPEKYLRAIDRLRHNLHQGTAGTYRFTGARIKAAQDVLQRHLIHQTLKKKSRLIDCYAGKLNLVLAETGEVYPCEMLSESFGNVREHDYDLMKVLVTSQAKNTLAAIRNQQCYCTHECYFITNILFNPAMYPALGKEYLRLLSAPHSVGIPVLRS